MCTFFDILGIIGAIILFASWSLPTVGGGSTGYNFSGMILGAAFVIAWFILKKAFCGQLW